MNSYLVSILVFTSSLLALSFAAITPHHFQDKEDQAIKECNATIPVQRNIRTAVTASIVSGETSNFTHQEKCHLNCFLQKVGFFDENSFVKGEELVNFTITQDPRLANYSDVVIAQVFQLVRSTKGIDENCQRAFVVFHQYMQNAFHLSVAYYLHFTHIKQANNDPIKTGKPVNEEISKEGKSLLEWVDVAFNKLAETLQKENQQLEVQTSPAPLEIYNVQSQTSTVYPQ